LAERLECRGNDTFGIQTSLGVHGRR
jgi:hypothetical protein